MDGSNCCFTELRRCKGHISSILERSSQTDSDAEGTLMLVITSALRAPAGGTVLLDRGIRGGAGYWFRALGTLKVGAGHWLLAPVPSRSEQGIDRWPQGPQDRSRSLAPGPRAIKVGAGHWPLALKIGAGHRHLPLGPSRTCVVGPTMTWASCMGGPVSALPWGPAVCNWSFTAEGPDPVCHGVTAHHHVCCRHWECLILDKHFQVHLIQRSTGCIYEYRLFLLCMNIMYYKYSFFTKKKRKKLLYTV